MSSAQQIILLFIVFCSAVAVLGSSVMSLIAFYKHNATLRKSASVTFWISIVILIIFLKLIDMYQ
ncbi:hypothetical protein C0213_07145 [Latilactobacillus sakei]|nr:hypothetical protein [Latilactobacillus sakei]AUX12203.1 hypothetical protein C0213_07145 [Latilactobacillus sakei]